MATKAKKTAKKTKNSKPLTGSSKLDAKKGDPKSSSKLAKNKDSDSDDEDDLDSDNEIDMDSEDEDDFDDESLDSTDSDDESESKKESSSEDSDEDEDDMAEKSGGEGDNAAALAAAGSSTEMSASFKNFRHHPDMENFYRFIFENDLRHEALEILNNLVQNRHLKKPLKK